MCRVYFECLQDEGEGDSKENDERRQRQPHSYHIIKKKREDASGKYIISSSCLDWKHQKYDIVENLNLEAFFAKT